MASRTLDAELLKAVRSDNCPKVESLLKRGASPDAADYKGSLLAYEIALRAGYYDIATLLEKKGADTRRITKVMITARKADGRELFRLMAEKYDAKTKDEEGNTALTYAIMADSLPCASMLLQYGCSVDSKNDQGGTPLFMAQSPEMIRFLLEHGAKINAKDDYNETPLFAFVVEGRVDLVKTALTLGADPNVIDKGGRNTLGWVTGECDQGDPAPFYIKIRELLKAIGAKEIGKNSEG